MRLRVRVRSAEEKAGHAEKPIRATWQLLATLKSIFNSFACISFIQRSYT